MKTLRIKAESSKEAFLESALRARQIASGALGWSGQARMMVGIGLDKKLGISGKKRLRVKRMKRVIKQAFIDDVFQHLEMA